MPKPDGTMTFEEYMEEQANELEFEPGDTAKKHLERGNKILEEEIRKEDESRLRRLRKKREKYMLKKLCLQGRITKSH